MSASAYAIAIDADTIVLTRDVGTIRRTLDKMQRHPKLGARLEKATWRASFLERPGVESTARERAVAWAKVESAHAALAKAVEPTVAAPVIATERRPREKRSRRTRTPRAGPGEDEPPPGPVLELTHQVDAVHAPQLARELARVLVAQAMHDVGVGVGEDD